ncbi:hypothetical protein DYB32_010849, partial [Aphanomyces invadans]
TITPSDRPSLYKIHMTCGGAGNSAETMPHLLNIFQSSAVHTSPFTMPNYSSEPKTRQEKKGNKAKRNFELNGKYTAKHMRCVEAAKANRTNTS